MQLGDELVAVDPEPDRDGDGLAVHEDVQVLVDVLGERLLRQRGEPERSEAVGQRVEPGVPWRRAGLQADERALLRDLRRRAVVPAEDEHEQARDHDRGQAGGREEHRHDQEATVLRRAGTLRIAAPLGRLDLARWCGRAGLLGHWAAMLPGPLTTAAEGVSLVESDPESRKVLRIWHFLCPLRIR